MKKIVYTLLLSIAFMVLNGCNSNSDGNSSPKTFKGVDVAYLKDGFIVDGRNRAGESVTLEYCNNRYTYYSGTGHWYGHFSIKRDRINMFDETATGGSYRLDTYNNFLEVGVEYSIDFQNDEIIVAQITQDLNCR